MARRPAFRYQNFFSVVNYHCPFCPGRPSNRADLILEAELPIAAATKEGVLAVLTVTLLAGSAASAADTPTYMQTISGPVTSSAAEPATKNVLALNTAMFGLYDA